VPAARLDELRATAVELSAQAALLLGDPGAELDALGALLATEPLRESAAALLARCLHAGGRQVEALAVLDRTRERLAVELGVDPGPALDAARLAVLRGAPGARRPPAPLTSFVGRAADVRRVVGLLATHRLVTLTGPGGAGKTRLARELVRTRPGESSVVELAPVGTPDRLLATVLDAVSSAEIVARIPDEVDVATRLVDALADRELLLVLDNCEHLVDAAARLVQILLERVPGLRILATSRERDREQGRTGDRRGRRDGRRTRPRRRPRDGRRPARLGAAQRGASDLGDPEVRATITAVRAALGEAAADAAVAHARGLARPDGVALLQDYARGAGSGSATAVSASATSRA
jgi:hypothetical protein